MATHERSRQYHDKINRLRLHSGVLPVTILDLDIDLNDASSRTLEGRHPFRSATVKLNKIFGQTMHRLAERQKPPAHTHLSSFD